MLASNKEEIEAAHPTLESSNQVRREGDGEGEDANEERGKGVSLEEGHLDLPPGCLGGGGGRPAPVPRC